ncbi:TonB-dependent siderophore receptor [Horticoccus sp. 23ND18S-11]|uniref:TonB-dependent siderophore receptor n=1 Tax=Horticoccus sp. 23ND18S-11 TaxID=3391832 RepID=UPI0039C96E6D
MNPRSLPTRLSAAGLCAALLVSALHAQTTPATPAARPADDVVKLSEFSVRADGDRGYAPSETLTGSRVKTQIADLPYTVNVLTSEFFEDFGIFELSDNVIQIGGFTGLDVGGSFNLRGFSSSSQLRDGFFRLGRYGSSNVDRMEVIKGSNAAIYGRTSPGGMLNMISKQPKSRESQKLTFNYGDEGTQRVTLETTGPILNSSLGKTSYILTGSHYQKEFDQEYARNRNQEYYLAVSHDFPDGSNLFLSAEYFLQLRHSPNSSAPLITDQKGTASNLDDEAIGYAFNLARYNAFGPNSELTRGNTGFNAVYDKKLNSVWSTRVAANYYLARRWDFNQNTGWGAIIINPANTATPVTSARGATPNTTRIIEDGGGFQGDILAHYWTNNRALEHRTLVTLDINDYYRWDPSLNYAGATNPDLVAWNAVRTVTLDRNYNPVAPLAYFPKLYDPTQGVKTRHQKRRTTVFGGLLRQQTSFMNGRLLTFAGARFDDVRFRDTDYIGFAGYVPGTLIDKSVNLLKPNYGFNYKITQNFRVYASYSESYFVSQNDNAQAHFDPTYKSEVADGYDYGFKGSFFNDRLTYTISGYYANRNNVSVTDNIETPLGSGNFVQVTVRDGDQLVRGYEIDLTWRVTDAVSAGGSWGHVYSVYTDFGTASPAAIGRRVINISPQNGSAYVRYAPREGLLKNLSGNIGVAYVASTPTEAPTAGDTYVTTPGTGARVVTRSTNQWRLRVPSFNVWSIGLRYKLPAMRNGIDHSLALNVNNLFDREYLRVNRLIGEPRSIYFSYTINRTGARNSR